MSCREIMDGAVKQQAESKLDCPIKLFPRCHHKAPIDIFVDGKKRTITLVCSKCDRTISQVHVRKDPNGDKT